MSDIYRDGSIVRFVQKKLDLSFVTLLCADCVHVDKAIAAIERCKALCDFGDVKLLTSSETDYCHRISIDPLTSLSDYSVFMLTRAHEFVDTTHVLVCQHDGWILNADVWSESWSELDYVGPLFIHEHVISDRSVGTGGFSFRSKRLMSFVAKKYPKWDGTERRTEEIMRLAGCYEDGVISMSCRADAVCSGMRYASPLEASRFAQGGNNDPNYYIEKPFGFHGFWPNVNFETGLVSPPPFWYPS